MKKFLLIFLILVFTNILVVVSKPDEINKELVYNYLYKGVTLEEKNKLKKDILLNVLNATDHKKWITYADYIDLKIYRPKSDKNSKEYIIFALNLSKDTGLIAIYKTQPSGNYSYYQKITNLAPIKNVSFFNNFLIIQQHLDERLGAFFLDDYIQIFTNVNNSFKSVFKKSVNYEEIYKKSWIDKEAASNIWIRTTKTALIDYVNETPEKIIVITNETSFIGTSQDYPTNDKFNQTSNTITKEIYIWDDKKNEFVLNKEMPMQ